MDGTPSFRPFEHPELARFGKTRSLLAYWGKLHGDLDRPTRTDLDPAGMKPFLANVLTGHIEAEPFRVLYRLVGTRVVEYSRFDFSNRYLDQLETEDRDDVDWEGCYRFVHSHRLPVIGDSGVKGASGHVVKLYEYAILPLWRGDDPAGSFVAIEVYDDIQPHVIPSFNPVELKAQRGL